MTNSELTRSHCKTRTSRGMYAVMAGCRASAAAAEAAGDHAFAAEKRAIADDYERRLRRTLGLS